MHIDQITLADCENMLEMFGWVRRKSPGSHRLYHKKGYYPFNLPTLSGREIKKTYKIELRDFLEQQYPEEFRL
jgi:predicted RNA binding protein YcfA (HicA-like mRNA interferase family)